MPEPLKTWVQLSEREQSYFFGQLQMYRYSKKAMATALGNLSKFLDNLAPYEIEEIIEYLNGFPTQAIYDECVGDIP